MIYRLPFPTFSPKNDFFPNSSEKMKMASETKITDILPGFDERVYFSVEVPDTAYAVLTNDQCLSLFRILTEDHELTAYLTEQIYPNFVHTMRILATRIKGVEGCEDAYISYLERLVEFFETWEEIAFHLSLLGRPLARKERNRIISISQHSENAKDKDFQDWINRLKAEQDVIIMIPWKGKDLYFRFSKKKEELVRDLLEPLSLSVKTVEDDPPEGTVFENLKGFLLTSLLGVLQEL